MTRLVISLVVVACLWTGTRAWLFKHRSGPQSASTPKEDTCIEKAKRGDCDFYTCFDSRHHCQFHNYALNYGVRFCQRFDERRARFSEKAWTWINNTRVCKMKKLLPQYEADTIDCAGVEHVAKHAHSECSAANGLCDVDMLWRHRHVLTDVYKPSRRAAVRFLMGVKSCGLHHARRLLRWVILSIARAVLPFVN